MVELIPAKFYLTKDPEMDDSLSSNKYWVNKKPKAPKQFIKEATKRARRVKLDPDSHKTVLEQQKDAHDSEITANTDDSDVVHDGKKGFSVETVRSTELGDLRERLSTKINSLKGKRKTREDEPEKFVIKKQKIVEKRKRVKEARKRKKKLVSADVKKENTHKERPSIKDESGKIVFSKFDFSVPLKVDKAQKTKDYKRLLAKAEATEKKLEELKKNDQKRGQELQEKLQWRKAIDLAKGTKVKDDPKLIKKTLKRLEKKKSKSQKQWTERADQEQQQKSKKQELRKKHIQERIDNIKVKKSKKKFNKGKKRTPGF